MRPREPGSTGAGAQLADLIRERGAPLLQALEERLPHSRGHADATASWALAIAVEWGLDRDRCLAIREAARLHDLGRLYADAELAAKPATELTPDDALRLDRSAEAGSRLAAGAGVPQAACAWLAHGRERFDGQGVPDGLAGEAIPPEARIIRTACEFDLQLDRARGGAGGENPHSHALARLSQLSESALDPATIEALERALSRAVSR